MIVNTHITTLTSNNTISEMMLKVNEIIYNFDNYFSPNVEIEMKNLTVNNLLTVNTDIILANNSLMQHLANNFAHGVVIENLSYNSNTGVLQLSFNDNSTALLNLYVGYEVDAIFKTVTANTFYGQLVGNADTSSKWLDPINISLNGDVYGNTNIDGSSNVVISVDIPSWISNSTNVIISSNTLFQNNVTIPETLYVDFLAANTANVDILSVNNLATLPNFVANSSLITIPNDLNVEGITSLSEINISGDQRIVGSLNVNGSATFEDGFYINGGGISSNNNTFNFIPNSSTLYIGSGSSIITLGSLTGTVFSRNNLNVGNDLNIAGQNLTSNSSIFNLLGTSGAINLGGSSYVVNIGGTTGNTNIRNNARVSQDLTVSGNTYVVGTVFVNSGKIDSPAISVNLFSSPEYITIGETSKIIDIGNASGNVEIVGNLIVDGVLRVTGDSTIVSNVHILGGTLDSPDPIFYLLPTTNNVIIGSGSSTTSVNNLNVLNNVTVSNTVNILGNLTVSGNTTFIDTETIKVKDRNIELAVVDSPTDVTADGGGITLKGTPDKTIIWDILNYNWSSSENWNLASGKVYKINNVEVLNSTGLGSTIVNSSLTSVGNVVSGTWNSNIGPVSGANLLHLTANNLEGTIPSTVLGNSTVYVGTTGIPLNRASSIQTLSGVSIDGTANNVAADHLTGTTLSSNVLYSSLTTVGTLTSGTWSASTIAQSKGGTGITDYLPGDILYADAFGILQKLPAGSIDQILQIDTNGIPHWITNIDGGNY